MSAQREEKDPGQARAAPVEAVTPGGDGMLGWANSVNGAAVQRKIQRRAKERRVADAGESETPAVAGHDEPHAAVAWSWTQPSSMTDAQRAATDAARWANKDRFDPRSIRILQGLLGLEPTGALSATDVRAIAHFQQKHGRKDADGIVDARMLDQLFAEGVKQGRHDELVFLVRDFFKLRLGEHQLSIRFDPALKKAAENRASEGALNVGVVGEPAFASAETLRDAIASLRAEKGIAPVQLDPTPTLLGREEIDRAQSANGWRLRDHRAVRAVQLAVDAATTGAWDDATIQFIAKFQAAAALPATGAVDDDTAKAIFRRLADLGSFNSAIRFAIDYYGFSAAGVLDVVFDPGLAEPWERPTSFPGKVPGKAGAPTTLSFGPPLFQLATEDAIHTIAHAYQDAGLTLDAKHPPSFNEREFLGARLEVLSRGMSEETFTFDDDGFLADAKRALLFFGDMKPEEQSRLWPQFVEVRDKVRERFQAAPDVLQQANSALLEQYERVQRPAPKGR